MHRALVEFIEGLIFWGSDHVLLTWANWRRRFGSGVPTDGERAEVLFEFERLVIAMRRDAGYPDTKVGRGDVLALWVTDIDHYR